jgi:hypothetical protein
MEPLVHLIIPTLILLAFIPKYKKLIFSLLIFSIIMDFDSFIPGFHRILFHNLFFALIVTLLLYFILGKTHSLISGYYLLSHLILDLEIPGFALLWPFYKSFIGIETIITKSTAGIWDKNFALVIKPIQEISSTLKISTYLSTTGFIFLIILCLGILLYLNKEKIKKKK